MPRDSALTWLVVAVVVTVLAMIAFVIFVPTPKTETVPAQTNVVTPSNVAWTEGTIAEVNGGDTVRGMVLARRCEKCHGEEGFSDSSEIPNLASMDKLAFWKQLEDYRAGKRKSALMQPQAAVLTRRDEADLTAYYALLPAIPDPQDTRVKAAAAIDSQAAATAARLVALGDGTRGIPPCQGCHGPVGNVRGAPSLATQNSDYILAQLEAFADGSRANDINLPMRTIAAQLNEEDRKALAQYYGSGLGMRPGGVSPAWKK